jgi:hypothetical protein
VGLTLVREDRVGRTSSVSVVAPAAVPSSYVRKGETLNASKRETLHKMRSPWKFTSLKAPGRLPGDRSGV